MDAPVKRVLHQLSMRERILESIEYDTNGGCWLWTRAADQHGYGKTTDDNRQSIRAHRAAYQEWCGALRPDDDVCHRCDVPACCNPDHLFVGTHRDNMDDMVAKRRHQHGGRGSMSKLKDVDVIEIRRRASVGERHRIIAADYGVGQPTISRIVSGARWGHL